MAYKIFIDGREGTTGLKILERFKNRQDLEILQIDEEKRKNPEERQRLINSSDVTFLCLPDEAARESVSLCTNPEVKILDTSTAHRVNPDWAYGFPELDSTFREKIRKSKRIAVPGCYASGFLSIVYPLRKYGIIDSDYPVSCHAVSGYSGGGKKAVAQYEDINRNGELDSPRQYALTQQHKHLPEMKIIGGLDFEPVFNPYICDYFNGMVVTIPVHSRLLGKKQTLKSVWEVFATHYQGCEFVKVLPLMGEGVLELPYIGANNLADTNKMEIIIYGNDDRICLCSRFDNLGKGASGAAVQCMNILLGVDEKTGLTGKI